MNNVRRMEGGLPLVHELLARGAAQWCYVPHACCESLAADGASVFNRKTVGCKQTALSALLFWATHLFTSWARSEVFTLWGIHAPSYSRSEVFTLCTWCLRRVFITPARKSCTCRHFSLVIWCFFSHLICMEHVLSQNNTCFITKLLQFRIICDETAEVPKHAGRWKYADSTETESFLLIAEFTALLQLHRLRLHRISFNVI